MLQLPFAATVHLCSSDVDEAVYAQVLESSEIYSLSPRCCGKWLLPNNPGRVCVLGRGVLAFNRTIFFLDASGVRPTHLPLDVLPFEGTLWQRSETRRLVFHSRFILAEKERSAFGVFDGEDDGREVCGFRSPARTFVVAGEDGEASFRVCFFPTTWRTAEVTPEAELCWKV